MPLTPETLENILSTGSTLGIGIHEDGRALRNYIRFDASNTRMHFMHAKDVLIPDAQFDAGGRVIVEKDGLGLVAEHHPFTDEAIALVKDYLDTPTFQERKSRMLQVMQLMPHEDLQRAIVERLEQEVPGAAGIMQVYEESLAVQRAEREKVRSDPRGYAEKMFASELEMNGVSLDDKANMCSMMRSLAVHFAANYKLPQLLEAIGPSGDFNPRDHIEDLLQALTARQEQKLGEPLVLKDEAGAEIIARICEARHFTMAQGGEYFHEVYDRVAAEKYDECVANGSIRDWVEKELQANPAASTMTSDLLKVLEPYQFDLEQMDNLTFGIMLMPNKAERLIHENPEKLMEIGRYERALLRLAGASQELGDPYHGRLAEEAKRVSAELVEAVPGHILEQAMRDHIPVMVDVGDPSHTTRMTPRELSQRGGYDFKRFGTPSIRLSPDMCGDIEREETGGLKQIARHEFRHYWAHRGECMVDPRLPDAIEADKAHFARVLEAVHSGDAAGEPLRREVAEILGPESTKALGLIKRINDPWVGMPEGGTAGNLPENPASSPLEKRPEKYATRVEKYEEAFSRVDEVVMVYGNRVADFLFPATHGLLVEMDGIFATKVDEHALPALRGVPSARRG